jgi:hypothetical protein
MVAMRSASLWSMCVLPVAVGGLVFSACGSNDSKKAAAPVHYPGEGGADGAAGEPGAAAGKTSSVGGVGASGAPGVGGDASLVGGAGAGGASGPNKCPAGFGDCDANPDCETPLDTVTACGACNISCDGSHGDVACLNAKCKINSCADGYDDCDTDPNTGCETKLDTDAHCGACTRDCAAAGATCTTGMCSVSQLSPNGNAWETAFGGGAEFVMKVNASPVGHYTLIRIPLAGGAEKTIWDADGGVGNGVMYADATDLYWSVNGNPASVVKKAVSAATNLSPTVLFQPTGNPNYLTIRGTAFFWMTGAGGGVSTLFTRATNAAMANTGNEIMNVDQHYVSAFTMSEDTIYWVARDTGPSHLSMVPLAGGTPKDVPDSVVRDGAPLFTVGKTLYFVRNQGNNLLDGIYSFTTGDTTVKQLVQVEGVTALIVDDTGIYYRVSYMGIINKSPLTGGAGVQIANVQGGLAGFAGQDAALIYTYNGWGSAGSAYKIVK